MCLHIQLFGSVIFSQLRTNLKFCLIHKQFQRNPSCEKKMSELLYAVGLLSVQNVFVLFTSPGMLVKFQEMYCCRIVAADSAEQRCLSCIFMLVVDRNLQGGKICGSIIDLKSVCRPDGIHQLLAKNVRR
jgi:hypothetical protein